MSFIIGLTGGIACGKSTAAQLFLDHGFAVLDTDHVAHDCMIPGEAGYSKIIEHFGTEIVSASGEINRKKLGKIVFQNRDELQVLNHILHPEVSKRWRGWREKKRTDKIDACIVIPLLFEVGATDGWDAIVVIRADENTVLNRLASRGLSRDAAKQRISAQMSIEEKAKRADIVIENNGAKSDFETKIKNVIEQFNTGRK